MLFDVVEYHLGESVVIPVASRKAHQREVGWQQAAVGQVVNRRHHFFVGQVAGDAEKHNGARAGDPRQALVLLVAQWITPLPDIGTVAGGAHLSDESSCFCVSVSS